MIVILLMVSIHHDPLDYILEIDAIMHDCYPVALATAKLNPFTKQAIESLL